MTAKFDAAVTSLSNIVQDALFESVFKLIDAFKCH
jgi:hypothetical protein